MRDEERFNLLSGYRAVWLFTLFDLPVLTKTDRRNYTRFRKALVREGFMMLQLSVYARYCASEEAAQ
jgi:CRISPR-associated protein Cas2